MFWVVRYNNALANLGINPARVNPNLRELSQHAGRACGYSPQETALLTISQLPLSERINLNLTPVRIWVRNNKVNQRAVEVRDAMIELGCEHV